MLGVAAVAALLLGTKKTGGTAPKLEVIPGGKSKKAAAKQKAKPSTPHAVVLAPAMLPSDTRSMALRAADQPVPSDMQPTAAPDAPIVDLDQASASEPASATPKLKPPKKPKPPKKRGASPPTAAKLAKPAKRSGKQAASDVKDYLDGGGNPGSRANRSDFVRAAQHDMGGLTADGVWGPKSRARAMALGVDIQH